MNMNSPLLRSFNNNKPHTFNNLNALPNLATFDSTLNIFLLKISKIYKDFKIITQINN